MKIQQFNDFQTDLLQSILWQYNQATNLLSLLNKKQTWYNANFSQFWLNWYNNVFDLSSPNLTLFGATVWSLILNIPLFVPLIPEPVPADVPTWGFNAFDPPAQTVTLENLYLNFTNGNFFPFNDDISLTIQEQQFLLRLRYFQLSNLGDIVDINAFLKYLCTNNVIGFTGAIYILDNQDMSVTYHSTTSDFPQELFDAISRLDVFPRPAGVAITYTGF